MGYKWKLITALSFFIVTWTSVFLIKSFDNFSEVYSSFVDYGFQNLSYLKRYLLDASLILIFGVIIPAFFISQIKCKKCGYRFLFDIYNKKPNPDGISEIRNLKSCPKCDSEIRW